MRAFLAGDPAPLLAAPTEDAVIKAVIAEGTPISGHLQGREGFLRYFAALHEVMEIQAIADAFLGEPCRLQRDVLGDATRAAARRHADAPPLSAPDGWQSPPHSG